MTHPQLVSKRLSPTCREAIPKSAILMLFFSSNSRFSGFKSLWLKKEVNVLHEKKTEHIEHFLLLLYCSIHNIRLVTR